MRLPALRRRRREHFQRAADGSMTLMEHLYELRNRLFKATVAIVVGLVLAWFISGWILDLLVKPYCGLALDAAREANHGVAPDGWKCPFIQLGPADVLLLKLKISMWSGLIIAAPFWLYQLWAFIAPGLHRHERRWTYAFAGAAAPLFGGGAVLAYFVVITGLGFLLDLAGKNVVTQLEITRYVDFVTGLMLIFGVAFLFPLAILLLNIAGVLSARRMLRWWRIAVFLFFAFAAVATPTADPFGMSFLGLALSGLYFGAVGLAFLNDRRRRRLDRENFGYLSDDEMSPLDYDQTPVGELDPVEPAAAIGPSEPVTKSGPVPGPRPLDRGYDDMT